MDVNHVNPFLEAFVGVMPQLGLKNVEKKGISVKQRYIESSGVLIIIGLMGDIKGNVIYGMSVEDAKKVASVMMMGMPVEEFDEIAQSAISELINMITATVATNFSKENITVDISTPTLIQGDFKANTSTDKVICVEMLADGARIDVNISLEKNVA